MGRGRKLTSRDAEILSKTLKVLDGHYGEDARQLIHARLKTVVEQVRLTRKGLKVTVPPPHIGRPQLLVVEKKTEVAAEKKSRQR